MTETRNITFVPRNTLSPLERKKFTFLFAPGLPLTLHFLLRALKHWFSLCPRVSSAAPNLHAAHPTPVCPHPLPASCPVARTSALSDSLVTSPFLTHSPPVMPSPSALTPSPLLPPCMCQGLCDGYFSRLIKDSIIMEHCE